MALTKERKIYLGLLAAGIGALAVDRLTSGPATAQAEDASAYVVARPDAPAATNSIPVAPAASGGTMTPGEGLAARLRELASKSNAAPGSAPRDLFRAPASWAPQAQTTQPVAKEPGPADFEKSHRLTAVLLHGRQAHAVVDGRMVAPGQSIDGYTLLSVTQDMAVFRSRLGTAVLRTEIKGP
jgi:hypothetical protein